MVVLDSSAFFSMVFEDERTTETPAMERELESGGAIVPGLWLAEVQNVLLVAERSGRISGATINDVIKFARSANISVDPVGAELTFGAELSLARSFTLTVHDAMYLELAQRRNLPLMTLDGALKKTAESLNLAWHKGYSALVLRQKRKGQSRHRVLHP